MNCAVMNLGGKFFDFYNGLLNFIANFRCWCQCRISQPIVTDHAIFVGICNCTRFKRIHISEGLLNSRLHFGKEFVIHIHATQVNCQTDFRKFGVVFLKSFPPLQFCVIHNFGFVGQILCRRVARITCAKIFATCVRENLIHEVLKLATDFNFSFAQKLFYR